MAKQYKSSNSGNKVGPNAAVQPTMSKGKEQIRKQGAKTENKGNLNVINRLNKSTHHTTSGTGETHAR